MDKRFVSQQDANMRVVAVFANYPDKIGSIPLLQTKSVEFTALTVEFTEVSTDAVNVGRRPALNRKDLRIALEKQCFKLGNCIQVYARTIHDIDVIEKTHTTISSLKRLQYFDLLIYAKFLDSYATENAEVLLTVGVTEESRSDFSACHADFESHYEEPQERVNLRKACNVRLKEIAFETRDMMEQDFDPLISTFSENDPFRIAYDLARIVRDPISFHHTIIEETSDLHDL